MGWQLYLFSVKVGTVYCTFTKERDLTMKTKILVLDAYTNGHEAALKFIRKMHWPKRDCEIIFCGSHTRLLQKLTQGPAYAVVPVHNSIAGEVTEVTKKLAVLAEQGYQFESAGQIDLQINHCLLAPQHIENVEQLERVISHEKAIQQCGRYLDRIGISADKRNQRDSTGNAAKYVSKQSKRSRIGAIAPRDAAKAYGLKFWPKGSKTKRKTPPPLDYFIIQPGSARSRLASSGLMVDLVKSSRLFLRACIVRLLVLIRTVMIMNCLPI